MYGLNIWALRYTDSPLSRYPVQMPSRRQSIDFSRPLFLLTRTQKYHDEHHSFLFICHETAMITYIVLLFSSYTIQ
jgi:hypothetical protein